MSVREKCDEKSWEEGSGWGRRSGDAAHCPMVTKEESPSVSVSDLPWPLLKKREKWRTPSSLKSETTKTILPKQMGPTRRRCG
jgi:hypothetical protein